MRGLRLAVIVFAIAVSALAVGFVGTAAANPVDIDPDTDLDGEGVDGDPYIITNVSELQAMEKDLSAHYELNNSIDASETEDWNDGEGFDPIGEYYSEKFTGTFNGSDHTVSGLYINREPGSLTGVGLFGNTDDNALIERIGLEDIDIHGDQRVGGLVGYQHGGVVSEAYASGAVGGDDFVGGLTGAVGGDLRESYATSDVDGNYYVGGLAGAVGGDLRESYATGDVDGDEEVGGLVGRNIGGDVSESYATGDVDGDENVGGLVGRIRISGQVSESYWDTKTTGKAESAGSSDDYGLTTAEMTGLNAPSNMTALAFTDTWHATESYPALAWQDTDPAFEVEMTETNAPITEGETLEVTVSVTNWGADGIQNIELLNFTDASVDEYANLELDSGESKTITLSWETEMGDADEAAITVTGDSDTDTRTVEIRQAVVLSGSVTNGVSDEVLEGIDVELVDKSEINTTGSDGAFEFTVVDGGTYNLSATTTVDDAEIADTTEVTIDGATVQNLILWPELAGEGTADNPYDISNVVELQLIENDVSANYTLVTDIDASGTNQWNVDGGEAQGFDPIGEDGDEFTGSFNGSDHAISNLTIDRDEDDVGLFGRTDGATIQSVGLVDAAVTGSNDVGGLVGYNDGGDVAESYATGAVNGSDNVGGLVGHNRAEVSKSYATGDVEGTGSVGGLVGRNEANILESYATGNVEGASLLGGLVGRNPGTVEDSYWDIETTGQTDSAGGEDLTTDQMTGTNATALMSGFEFPAESTEGSWHATGAYPALAWQDTEPFYGVNVTDTNAPVDEGEPLEVTANVTNWAADGDRTVELRDFDGDERDTEAVTLESGDSEERTLQWDTAVSDAGTGSVTVTSGDDSDSEAVTVEAVADAATGGGTSSSSTSVDGDGTTSVRTVGDELRADVTPSVIDGVSESHLEFSNTRTIGLQFFTEDTAAEDRPVATTEQLDIELSESIDTALTIREGNTPTTDGARDLDQGLEAGGYLQIATDFEPDQLESATIEFTAPREALDIADGDIDEVSLYHFDSDADEWQPLETTVVDEAEDEIRFSAAVDSFSQFAVGVGTPNVDNPGSTSDEMEGNETSIVDDDASSAGDTDRDGTTEAVEDGTPGFGVGITLLAVVVFLTAGQRFRDVNCPTLPLA